MRFLGFLIGGVLGVLVVKEFFLADRLEEETFYGILTLLNENLWDCDWGLMFMNPVFLKMLAGFLIGGIILRLIIKRKENENKRL